MTAALCFGKDRWDGEDIDRKARVLAGAIAEAGVEDGDVIALMLRNDPAYPLLIQACRIAGCYYCPINWHFKGNETAYILRDSGAKILFIHDDLLPPVESALPPGIDIVVIAPHPDTARAYGLAAPPLPGAPGTLDHWEGQRHAYQGTLRTPRGHMAYTSGTTGNPKGIRRFPAAPQHRERQMTLAMETLRTAFGIFPGVRTLVSAPIYHSAPSLFVQQALLQAECLVVAPKFDAEETLALIERHRIQTAYLVPVMYVRLLRLPEEIRLRYDLSSLQFVASTGSPCAPEVKRAMIAWLGPVIHETYASSETGLVTAIDSIEAEARPGSVGKALGEAEIRIFNAEGLPCKTGEIGIIHVRQPAYSDFTYNNNDAARRAIEHEGLISVGDMGYLDEDGYLYICDRASDMVISGGVNIYPAEIEHVLIHCPGVSDCAVFGIPDAEYGEALAAAVTLLPETALSPAQIQAWLKERIAGYKVPRRIDIHTALPRDDNGKIAKRKLRDPFWENDSRRI